MWESVSHKKLPALNAQWNLRNSFTHKSFKHLQSKKFQTFRFPIINCWLFCPMVERFCLAKLHHHWSMSNNWWLFQGLDVHIPHFNIRLNHTHHGFQLLVLLPWFVEITFFVCTKRINLRKASNYCKSVLQAAKLAYAN